MNRKIIDFALEAGVLNPVQGVVEEDNVERFVQRIVEESIHVIRYMENPKAQRDDTYLNLEWERGKVDACHAINSHFGFPDHWLCVLWYLEHKENRNE